MDKFVLITFLVTSLSAYSAGFLPNYSGRTSFSESVYNRYCSPEALEDQLSRLKSEEERQLVAALLQLELLGASDEVFQKIESSKAWKSRTPQVTRLLKNLLLDDSGLASLNVYQKCFDTLSPDDRVMPGFEGKARELMQPSMLARRVLRS